MKKPLKFFLLTTLIIGIAFAVYYYQHSDDRSNTFFADLLKVDKSKTTKVCLDYNLSALGTGKAAEEYKLSDETFISFVQSYKNYNSSNYLKKFDNVAWWSKTPNTEILSNVDLSVVLDEHQKCYNESFLRGLLEEDGNYCSVAYTSKDFFAFIIIDSKTKSIYLVENTW